MINDWCIKLTAGAETKFDVFLASLTYIEPLLLIYSIVKQVVNYALG